MKKVTYLLFTLALSLSIYAQGLVQTENLKSQEMIQKKQAEITRIQQEQASAKALKSFSENVTTGKNLNNVTAEEIFWTDDFEGDVSAWSTYDAAASPVPYTNPSSYNALDGMSWWCGIESAEGWTGYGNNWIQRLTTINAIDLSGATAASFKYDLAYDSEPGYDYTHVQASSDGITWDELATYDGTAGWANYEVDLTDYVGGTVWVRFLFTSDGAWSDADGLNPTTAGAYQADNLTVVIDGTDTLLDDGGDTVTGFEASSGFGSFFTLIDTDAASGTHSFQAVNYAAGSISALESGDIDLSTVPAGASISIDFSVKAEGVTDDGNYSVEISSDGGATWENVTGFIYTGSTSGWITFKAGYGSGGDNSIDAYLGETIRLRWLFSPAADAPDATAGVYIDDPTILVLADPYEDNNTPATATVIDAFPFETEGALMAAGDTDYYTFAAEAGQWINIYADNHNVDLEMLVASLDAGGSPSLWLIPDDPHGAYYADWVPYDQVFINTYTAGNYILRVRLADRDPASTDAGPYKLYVTSPTLAPEFTSLVDVPNDNGFMLRGAYTHSDFADPMMTPWQLRVEKYHIERRSGLTTWSFINTVPVIWNGSNNTNVIVPTASDDATTVFKLIAETNLSPDMVHDMYQGSYPWMEAPRTLYERGFKYASDVESGTSVDNIAPVILGAGAEKVTAGTKVYWEVEQAEDLLSYEVRRSAVSGQEGEVVFSTTDLSVKSFVDTEADRDYYYVVSVSDDGNNVVYSKEVNPSITGIDEDAGVPTVYSLGQNYPNPFNPATTIKFGIPMNAKVSIKIFDVLGQEVADLVNSDLAAGFHNINFDASNLNSGMYVYRIQAQGVDGNNFVQSRKMLLVK